MFGMRHSCGSPDGGKWAARRGWRGHVGPGQGWGGRHGGMGGGEMMRAGRMLAQGDLRLIALALIAEQPRHGYEIIKVLETRPRAGTRRAQVSSIRRSLIWRKPATSPCRRTAPRSFTASPRKAAAISPKIRTSWMRCWVG